MPRIQFVPTGFHQKSTQKGTEWTSRTDTLWICSHSLANLAQGISEARGSVFLPARSRRADSLSHSISGIVPGEAGLPAGCSTASTKHLQGMDDGALKKHTEIRDSNFIWTRLTLHTKLKSPIPGSQFYPQNKIRRGRMAFHLISFPTCTNRRWGNKPAWVRMGELDPEKFVCFLFLLE